MDLRWARRESSPKRAWKVCRQCLQVAFCNQTPPNQHAHHSMNLDQLLGTWYLVDRNTLWPCYRTADAIYRREEEMKQFKVFCEQPTIPGFFQHEGNAPGLPLDSHPIQYQNIGLRKSGCINDWPYIQTRRSIYPLVMISITTHQAVAVGN